MKANRYLRHALLALCMLTILTSSNAQGTFSYGDHWYDNPLGFAPLNLHTSMGFFVPAAAVAACVLLTHKDTGLQHRLSVYNESGFSWGYKYPNTFLSQNNTGFTFKLRRWMSVGAEFDAYFPTDPFNRTVGLALRPFARFYPVNREKFRCYFESGGGFVYLFDQFPKPTDRDGRLGTQVNGTTKYGVGVEVALHERFGLLAGLRHLHISNGNRKGVERNPSHDSNGFFIGFQYTFQ